MVSWPVIDTAKETSKIVHIASSSSHFSMISSIYVKVWEEKKMSASEVSPKWAKEEEEER